LLSLLRFYFWFIRSIRNHSKAVSY